MLTVAAELQVQDCAGVSTQDANRGAERTCVPDSYRVVPGTTREVHSVGSPVQGLDVVGVTAQCLLLSLADSPKVMPLEPAKVLTLDLRVFLLQQLVHAVNLHVVPGTRRQSNPRIVEILFGLEALTVRLFPEHLSGSLFLLGMLSLDVRLVFGPSARFHIEAKAIPMAETATNTITEAAGV